MADQTRDTTSQYRLTSGQAADIARALMTRHALVGRGADLIAVGAPPASPGEGYRLAQLIDKFTR